MTTLSVAVPRKGRPLEAVLERVAAMADAEAVADRVASTLRYEKAVTKGEQTADEPIYERLAEYSDTDAGAPEFTLLRDGRPGLPRRVVFDSLRVDVGGHKLRLVGREERSARSGNTSSRSASTAPTWCWRRRRSAWSRSRCRRYRS